jgi:hypothetical protein
MSNWNIGSFSNEIFLIVENVPSSNPTLSGVPLNNIIERNIDFCERYSGESIGTTSIPIRYQGAIIDFSVADVLDFMNLQGTDASSYSIEGFSVSKGGESNLEVVSKKFREMGMRKLQEIGHSMRFAVSNG